jgi:hypothetical protein
MKLVIRERKVLKEQEEKSKPSLEFKTTLDPANFLALTPPDETIKKRAEKVVGKFDPAKAGVIYLAIDPKTGEVVEHGGRARSQAAINSGLSAITVSVKLKLGSEPMSWNDLPKMFVQQEGSKKVSKDEFQFVGLPAKESPYIYKLAIVNGDKITPLSLGQNKESLKRLKRLGFPPNRIVIHADTNQPVSDEELAQIFS